MIALRAIAIENVTITFERVNNLCFCAALSTFKQGETLIVLYVLRQGSQFLSSQFEWQGKDSEDMFKPQIPTG